MESEGPVLGVKGSISWLGLVATPTWTSTADPLQGAASPFPSCGADPPTPPFLHQPHHIFHRNAQGSGCGAPPTWCSHLRRMVSCLRSSKSIVCGSCEPPGPAWRPGDRLGLSPHWMSSYPEVLCLLTSHKPPWPPSARPRDHGGELLFAGMFPLGLSPQALLLTMLLFPGARRQAGTCGLRQLPGWEGRACRLH